MRTSIDNRNFTIESIHVVCYRFDLHILCANTQLVFFVAIHGVNCHSKASNFYFGIAFFERTTE